MLSSQRFCMNRTAKDLIATAEGQTASSLSRRGSLHRRSVVFPHTSLQEDKAESGHRDHLRYHMTVIHQAWWGGPSFWGNDFRPMALFQEKRGERPGKYPGILLCHGWSHAPTGSRITLSIIRRLQFLRKDFMSTAVQIPGLAGYCGCPHGRDSDHICYSWPPSRE